MSEAGTKAVAGWLGFVVGVATMILAFFGADIVAAIDPPPSVPQTVVETAREIKDLIARKRTDRPSVLQASRGQRLVSRGTMGLGCLGLVLCALAFARGESRRVLAAGAALNVAGLIWYYAMLALAALVLFAILIAAIHLLDLDLS